MEIDFEKAFLGGLLVTAFAFAVFGAYCAVRSVAASGRTEFCYVEVASPNGMSPQYMLHGYVNWRNDRHLGTFASLDEARKAADLIGCPLGSK